MTDLNALDLPNIALSTQGDVLTARLMKSEKRNALDEEMIRQLIDLFAAVPKSGVKAVVLCADGPHFCAGLDLKEHYNKDRSAAEFMQVCRGWHQAFNNMQHGGVPVVAALKGAVVGGGLELASAAHIRVADQTTYFALPEGQRGIFTGGGATVRVAELVGKHRMIDMMLTGRIYMKQEAMDVGLCQYLVAGEDSETLAQELAAKIVQNPSLSNMAITSAIDHISHMSGHDAYFAEAFIAGVVNTQEASRDRLKGFVEKTAPKTKPSQTPS